MTDLITFEGLNGRQNEGLEFPIVGALREPTGITVRVAGPDSERQKKARHKVVDRRLWRQRLRYGDNARYREDEEIELVAAAIMDWSGIEKDGEPFSYSPENAEYLVRTYRVFRDQIDLFASSRAFFHADPTEPPNVEGERDGEVAAMDQPEVAE